MIRIQFFILSLLLAVFVQTPTAQSQAVGTDMWTKSMMDRGLFTPHTDYCDSSEVFIPMGAGSNLGYCIEKAETSAVKFVTARESCAAAGKRLPEPAEFRFACELAPAGLANMTGNWEWASNFTVPFDIGSGTLAGPIAGTAGYDACGSLSWNFTGSNNSTYHNVTAPYRCVR